MWKTWVQSLGWEDPPEKGIATHSSILRIPWNYIAHGVAKSWTWLSNFHFTFTLSNESWAFHVPISVRTAQPRSSPAAPDPGLALLSSVSNIQGSAAESSFFHLGLGWILLYLPKNPCLPAIPAAKFPHHENLPTSSYDTDKIVLDWCHLCILGDNGTHIFFTFHWIHELFSGHA